MRTGPTFPFRGSFGPFVVDDLDATREELIKLGATITRDHIRVETACLFYASHPDCTEVEYLQGSPNLSSVLYSTNKIE